MRNLRYALFFLVGCAVIGIVCSANVSGIICEASSASVTVSDGPYANELLGAQDVLKQCAEKSLASEECVFNSCSN